VKETLPRRCQGAEAKGFDCAGQHRLLLADCPTASGLNHRARFSCTEQMGRLFSGEE
jgi:hypothetical protein